MIVNCNQYKRAMRLFDELTEIKHSSGLMQPKRLIYLLAACLAALGAYAQTTPPASPGTNATFTVQATGTAPLTYQWYLGTNALVATNNSGTLTLAQTTGQPAPAAKSFAPAQTRDPRSLTLDECIKLALEHNLDIQIQRYNPIIDMYNVNVNYGVYEPVATFTGLKSYNDIAGGVDPTTGQPISGIIREVDSYNPAIVGSLPTGLTYDITGGADRNTALVGPPAHYGMLNWSSDFNVSLTQPLLKNFWIDNNRLQIQLSKVALKTSEAALQMQIMTSITAVKSAYFNLLYARGNVDANATAYKLAEQLVSENLKRVEVGALAPLDEKQSESQAAASLAAMQVAEQTRLTDENTLKNLLTDHYSEWANVTLLPAEQLVALPEELNLQESWRKAVTQRPDLLEAKLNIEKQNVTLKYNFNQIFPELDLKGSYGRNADLRTFSESINDLGTGNHSSYTYGAFVSIPLGGNYSARNTYKSSKATLKQDLLALKQTEQTILVAVDNDVGNVRSTLQQVDATRDARIYAEDALAAERKKLENGKSTSFIVLQLISNLTTAKVAEVQALANYNIAVAQLALDEGSTLEVNHIDVKVK